MKLIGNQSLFHMVLFILPVLQSMTVHSFENFATSQNWLFVAEVWSDENQKEREESFIFQVVPFA